MLETRFDFQLQPPASFINTIGSSSSIIVRGDITRMMIARSMMEEVLSSEENVVFSADEPALVTFMKDLKKVNPIAIVIDNPKSHDVSAAAPARRSSNQNPSTGTSNSSRRTFDATGRTTTMSTNKALQRWIPHQYGDGTKTTRFTKRSRPKAEREEISSSSTTTSSSYYLNDYTMPLAGCSTRLLSAPDQTPYQPKRRKSPSYIEISPLSVPSTTSGGSSSSSNADQRIHPRRLVLSSTPTTSTSLLLPTYGEALQHVEAKYSLPSSRSTAATTTRKGSPYPQQKRKTKITKSSSLDFTSHELCRFAWDS